MEEKEDFYHELDTKGRRSFCTCQSLAIIFLILALLLAGAIVWGVKKIKTAVFPARQVMATRQDSSSVQEKLVQLSQTAGASTSLTLTEPELTSLLADAIAKNPTIPLRGIQAQINPDGIVLAGTATKYLTTLLQIDVRPQVVDGRPKLQITKIQAGSLSVPPLLTQLLDKSLQDALATQLNELRSITVKSILLDAGRLRITGTVSPKVP